MPDDGNKKLPECPRGLWGVAFVMLALPNGLLVGTLFGLLSDFGASHTAANMRLNPQMFADQYAGGLVYECWFALASLAMLLVTAGHHFWFWIRKSDKHTQNQ